MAINSNRHRSSPQSAIFLLIILTTFNPKTVFLSVMAMRCYDGSAFHLGDAFITDAQLRPSKGLRFTNWNYILVKDNCTTCSTILFTQEPKQGDNTPTVLLHLVCEKAKLEAAHHGKVCALNEKKFKADIKAMDGVDLSNLELSDKVPDWEDRNDLKTRVSSRLLADLNATPLKTLTNAKRWCRTCYTDLCNYFDMNINVSCSIRFGVQRFYHTKGQMCQPQQGCLIHTNITWQDERSDRAVCLPKGCSRPSLAHCEKFCGDALTNKKCSCWCNGDYSVKSYNYPTEATKANLASNSGHSATDGAPKAQITMPNLLIAIFIIILTLIT